MKLLQQLGRIFSGDTTPAENPRAAPLAIASLLLEIARADLATGEDELQVIREHLTRAYHLSGAELDALIAEAQKNVAEAVSLYDPVTLINQKMGREEKRELLRGLWRVAYADGRLDPHEEALLRRLADLLYVPHSDFIREKLGVLGQ